MYTREDFMQKAIDVSLAKYPKMATLIKAGDVRVMQQLQAMATMLEMYSMQLEVAQSEPFEKTRDSTVLADAAMRGLIPKSSPAMIRINLKNDSALEFTIQPGRSLLDAQGRLFRVETPVAVPAGQTGSFIAVQIYSKEFIHTVSGSRPFYAIPIDLADDDSSLCGLEVMDSNGLYEYREQYTNTAADERVYHVEADERQRVYVRMGQAGVVGFQPIDGTELTIRSHYSMGDIRFEPNSIMVFEVMGSPIESQVEMRFDELVSSGENPPSIIELRELAKYPSVYNHNAVFLGEFDFLVRRNFPGLKFLSVWNEGTEEDVRGMSLDNINAIFVACLDEVEEVVASPDGVTFEQTELTEAQKRIKAKILAADDSYRVRFFAPVRSPIAITIKAAIPTSYEEQIVKEQIEEVILSEFGEQSKQSKRGRAMPLYQRIYQILREKIPALLVDGSDLEVVIEKQRSDKRPELWRYVSPETLSVAVRTRSCAMPYWGGVGL